MSGPLSEVDAALLAKWAGEMSSEELWERLEGWASEDGALPAAVAKEVRRRFDPELLKDARDALVAATGQENSTGLFTLGRMNDEKRAVVLWDRIGEVVRRIDAARR